MTNLNRARLIIAVALLVSVFGATVAIALLADAWHDSRPIRQGPSGSPLILDTRPHNRETGVRPDAFIAADVYLPTPGMGVDAATLTDQTIRLTRASDGAVVPATFSTQGANDQIVVQPRQPLEAGVEYRVEFGMGIRDQAGATFRPYTTTFTTATNFEQFPAPVAFEKITLDETADALQSPMDTYLGVTIGPDRKLYACSGGGLIVRWPILPDGRLGPAETIPTVFVHNNGPRLVTGLAFDPASTADNLIVWISHGESGMDRMADWTGKISRLSGRNLEDYTDVVVRLPRAFKDHLNLQPVFGPDGCLYFSQGSNTAMGGLDRKWNRRPERLLTAAVLRLDPSKLTSLPLDVKTEEDGRYDPYAPDAPLTIYATGVRVAYDLVFHSSGALFAPTNGSASGGTAPGTPTLYTGRRVPMIADVRQTLDDLLLRIEPGRYYGHPNPVRGEYTLFGGNPTRDVDPQEVRQYPIGTPPDPNYTPPAYVFGKNMSPNGSIEYRHDSFGGALRGCLLVTRLSGGQDILIIRLSESGEVVETIAGAPGMTQFDQPLDLVEDPTTGNLYVTEMRARRITLLRPIEPPPGAMVYRERL
jgi:glucose/arabinose dehydrogenase